MPNQDQATKRTTEANTTGNVNPSRKRSRVSRACDQCRTAREKCDGLAVCSTCSTSKRACSYTANRKKRGIQPGYIRTLELALTWLFNNSDAEVALNRKLAQEGTASVLLEKDTKESNRLHRSWRRSKFCKDIDKLLSGEYIGEEYSRSPDTDDQDTDIEEHNTPRLNIHGPALNPPHLMGTPGALNLRSGRSLRHEATPLPDNRWRLFDIYFAYTHCWFPICEKHDILKLSYTYPEQGLSLSPSMSLSGDHAELWAVLALASLQDTSLDNNVHAILEDAPSTPAQIYDVARSLIPRELGSFHTGHVKALLLLALVNLSQSAPEPAWLLIGHAARVIIGLEQQDDRQASRFRHIFVGCFILDTLVSIQLRRRPNLQSQDVERIGKIYEDGLEEWQPWTGLLDSASGASTAREPALSLSTFNYLAELVGIMSLAEVFNNSGDALQDIVGRFELWKSSLPPTFEHIRTQRAPIPSTPPALLLQLVYHCCSLAIFSSQSWAHRFLDLLRLFQSVLGHNYVPPVLDCLFDIVQRNGGFLSLDQGLQSQFRNIRRELSRAWVRQGGSDPIGLHHDFPIAQTRANIAEPRSARSRGSFTSSMQMPTPESMQFPLNTRFAPEHLRTKSTLLDELLPDMNQAPVNQHSQPIDFRNAPPIQGINAPPFGGSFDPSIPDQRNTTTSRDLESFFDELASLDGAERVDNQPQFMQNLGFAPDANISDLLASDLSQFNPLMGHYIQPGSNDAAQLDHAEFFDGG